MRIQFIQPVFVSIVFLSIFLAGCDQSATSTPAIPSDAIRPAKLFQVGEARGRNIRIFPATTLANQSVEMSFRLAGQLTDLKLVEGQIVKSGALLARLDDRDVASRLRDAEASHELAQANFERTQKLLVRKLVADSDFDVVKAQMKTAEAALETAQNNMEYTRLTAPFSGVIARLYVKNYQYIQPRQPVLLLQSTDKIDVKIQISEDMFMNARRDPMPKDFRPVLTFPGHPGKQFKVRYKEHSSEIDAATRSYAVTFTLDTPEEIWVVPGMSGELAIDMDIVSGRPENQFVVPVDAVGQQDSDGKSVVWVFDSTTQTAKPVAVTLGRVRKGGVEIISGLSGGEQIVAAGLSSIHEGMRLKPLRWERGI